MKSTNMILACTDGSIYSPSVYDHALWTAKRLNAHLHILHVVDPEGDPVSLKNFSGSIGLDSRQLLKAELVKLEEARGRVALAKSSAILESARNHIKAAGYANFNVDARHGHLAEIVAETGDETAFVVIGKRGEAADFQKLHLGASVERVIRSSKQPVMVTSRAFKPINKVLIAYDGGPSAKRAVDYTVSSPLLSGLECHILSVGKPHPQITEDLEKAHQRLQESGHTVEHHQLSGHPEDVFAQFIEDNQIDMLIMGAYGHSRVRQLIVGSTTTTMVRTCRIPVLMFR